MYENHGWGQGVMSSLISFGRLQGASHFLGWIVRILTPQDMTSGMLSRFVREPRAKFVPVSRSHPTHCLHPHCDRTKYNINSLSHDTAIGLIERAMAMGVKLSEVGESWLFSSQFPHRCWPP